MELPLVNKNYLLHKFPGKGGWTYAIIPEIMQDKNAPFGWVRVKGTIDGFEIKAYHLMPMGNGNLFLPVKAEIRKKIGKSEGDKVHVKLFLDDLPTELPDELVACFKDEQGVHETFLAFTDAERKAYIEWIYSAKKEGTKVQRIVTSINRIKKGLRLFDKQ